MKFSTPLLLKKSSPSSPEEVQDVSSLKTETEESIDVIIEINEKKSIDEVVDIPHEGITIKVNDKAVTLENSASTEEGKKFIDDLQQVVEEEDAPKQEEQQQQASSNKTTVVWGKKLMFWKHVAEKATKVEKEEEPVSEESKEQEQPVEQKEETEPIAEAEAEKKEEAQEEPSCGFLQGKLTYWQAEAAKAQKGEQQPVSDESKQEEETKAAETETAETEKGIITRWLHRTHVAEVAKEQKKEQPVSEEFKQEVDEAKPAENMTETEKKEVDDEASGHKIEFFVDGVAIQTIILTNAGMERLKNFIASVQEGATEAVSKSWLVEKMNEFFESAKNQDDALENAETPTPSVPAPVEEEKAEIVTSKAKRSWWPFGKTETKVVDEVRNETAEGTDVAATEEVRQGAEVA